MLNRCVFLRLLILFCIGCSLVNCSESEQSRDSDGSVADASIPDSSQVLPNPSLPSCKVDSDCTAGKYCYKRKFCMEKRVPPKPCSPNCPSGQHCRNGVCLSDPNCFGLCFDKYKCIERICVHKNVNCLPSCRVNQECEYSRCVDRKVPPAPKCSYNEIYDNEKCILLLKGCCASSCPSGTYCSNRRCVKIEPGSVCNPPCKLGQKCEKNRCTSEKDNDSPPPPPSPGSRCIGWCGSRSICLPTQDSFRYCFRKCIVSSGCSKGQVCASVGREKVCLVKASLGKECGLNCTNRGPCEEGLACLGGKCVRAMFRSRFEQCGRKGVCKVGDVCTSLTGKTKGSHFCLQQCEPKTLKCSNGSPCIDIGGGKGRCEVIGTAIEGAACKDFDLQALKLNQNDKCLPRLFCIQGRCQKPKVDL